MLVERLALLMRQRNINQVELAKKSGLTQGIIGNILNGRRIEIRLSTAQKLANGLDMSLDQFLGYGQSVRIKPIPVIGSAKASPEGAYYTDQDFPPGAANEYLSIEDEDAFALIVESDSMAPRIKPGDRIVITPNKKPIPNGLCVAKLRSGKVFLKRVEKTKDSVVLKSDNPDYPVLTVAKDEIEWIYRVDCIIPR